MGFYICTNHFPSVFLSFHEEEICFSSSLTIRSLTVCMRWWQKANYTFSPLHPSQISPPHLTDPWKKPCRFSQQEQARQAGTDAQNILSIQLEASCAPSVLVDVHDVFLSSVGLHETLALLTSQLRPDANHKEDMVFLKDVFSERSLGYLMKVRNSYAFCKDVASQTCIKDCGEWRTKSFEGSFILEMAS